MTRPPTRFPTGRNFNAAALRVSRFSAVIPGVFTGKAFGPFFTGIVGVCTGFGLANSPHLTVVFCGVSAFSPTLQCLEARGGQNCEMGCICWSSHHDALLILESLIVVMPLITILVNYLYLFCIIFNFCRFVAVSLIPISICHFCRPSVPLSKKQRSSPPLHHQNHWGPCAPIQ